MLHKLIIVNQVVSMVCQVSTKDMFGSKAVFKPIK